LILVVLVSLFSNTESCAKVRIVIPDALFHCLFSHSGVALHCKALTFPIHHEEATKVTRIQPPPTPPLHPDPPPNHQHPTTPHPPPPPPPHNTKTHHPPPPPHPTPPPNPHTQTPCFPPISLRRSAVSFARVCEISRFNSC